MRKTLGLLAGLLAVLAIAFGSNFGLQATPEASEEKECEVAARWVKENPREVPVTLDGIAALPSVYKRIVFNSLKPEQKSDLWREHLRRFLATEKLNDEQQAFVRMAIDFATPELYRDALKTKTPQVQAQHTAHHKAIREQALALFSPQLRRAFAELGHRTAAPAPLPPSLRTVSFSVTSPAATGTTGDCECEIGDNWCWIYHCKKGTCTPLSTGCGFLNCGPCNGMCGGGGAEG